MVTLSQVIDALVANRVFTYKFERLEIDVLADAYEDDGQEDVAEYVRSFDYLNLYGRFADRERQSGWDGGTYLYNNLSKKSNLRLVRVVKDDVHAAMERMYPE